MTVSNTFNFLFCYAWEEFALQVILHKWHKTMVISWNNGELKVKYIRIETGKMQGST